MKRRTLAVVLAAAMTAGMLVGCSGGGGIKTEQSAAPAAETTKQEEKTEAESGATEAAKEAENIVWGRMVRRGGGLQGYFPADDGHVPEGYGK